MHSSFLYYAWGLYHHKYLREEYKGNTIILHIESKRAPKYCPKDTCSLDGSFKIFLMIEEVQAENEASPGSCHITPKYDFPNNLLSR